MILLIAQVGWLMNLFAFVLVVLWVIAMAVSDYGKFMLYGMEVKKVERRYDAVVPKWYRTWSKLSILVPFVPAYQLWVYFVNSKANGQPLSQQLLIEMEKKIKKFS